MSKLQEFNEKMEARWEHFDKKMKEKYEQFEEKANKFFNHKITRICIAILAVTAFIVLIICCIKLFPDVKSDIRALGILSFCLIGISWITVERVIDALEP